MRKVIKKTVAVAMCLSMSFTMLTGCGKQEENAVETTTVDKSSLTPEEYYNVVAWEEEEYDYDTADHYRNYYEVFVYSYADSDGDGIGDLQGLISKLDYIEETGFNGIWLMPIMPSTTYHKYDITDYYNIDEQYGTLEDFEQLLEECHSRNINVIIDLVFNHTSSKHEWFLKAKEYYQSLEPGEEPDFNECPYADYYCFMRTDEVRSGTYSKLSGTEYSYECPFWDQMPDLNLSNEAVRKEIEDIAKFWLDLGVDGFRLDAAKEYKSGASDYNIEVLNWFSDYVKSVREDAYIVAEVWDTYSTIKKYYTSTIESIFDYAYGNGEGRLFKYLNQGKGLSLAQDLEKTENGYYESNPDMVNAPFASNHDTGRITSFTSFVPEKVKIAGAINQIMSGCSFVYYGEEIGMTGSSSSQDEDKRAPMYWSNFVGGVTTVGPPNMAQDIEHKFGSLEEQQEDIDSIYWYYRKMLHIRSTYEEIPKGRTTALTDLNDDSICGIEKTYNDESMYILMNLSTEEKTIDFSKNNYEYESLVEYLVTNTDQVVKLENDKITLPPYSIAFIK